ncbi:MAG TPA: ATP-dependent helicase [Bacteroidetes bacterium]|nr:ATP-dependent helicase [Bacteroidota bacterium]
MTETDLILKAINEFFSETGILSGHFDNYEYRHSQESMSEFIFETLQNKNHIFIEAPTGIGKSFAYLVPSIYFAKKNNKKVIVSTYTINLQEQLLNKDIPFLQKVLPVKFKAGILKGRNNYLCPKRLAKAMESSNTLFETEEQLNLEMLYRWSRETKDGTRSDLNFAVNENVWNSVCSERGICTLKTCGSENTKCFYQRAKKELADSDVIIVNHHLFFTLFDGISEEREGYLYNNDFLIFDEAHTIEQVATDHISPSVSREKIKYHLIRLYNQNKKKGFLLTLPSLHIQMKIQNLIDLNQQFFYTLRKQMFDDKYNRQKKLTARVYEKNITENILKPELDSMLDDLRALRPVCKDDAQENELNEYITRFSEFNYVIDDFINQKRNETGEDFVYWTELSSVKPDANVSICSSPVDVSEFFRENIFRENNITILTSATLTINSNFEYFRKRLGAEKLKEVKLESPFDFYRQVKILIPKNIPEPGKENTGLYSDILKKWISHFTLMTKGKALILFTNGTLLRKIGNELEDEFRTHDINLLIQIPGVSRNLLLEKFKSDINSVLFGLDSFWMGVDVPGEALSNLIITRLPFQVPDHPVVQAKMEYIEKNGGNSFYEYSLPEAILKFRQGIGRLIRHRDDQGIIAILDSRIITKPYGKYFINSLDECEIEIVEDFYDHDVIEKF